MVRDGSDWGYCPFCWPDGAQAECKGLRCRGWDRQGSRCCLETIAIGVWRLSTKLPGGLSDAAWKVAEALRGRDSQGKE